MNPLAKTSGSSVTVWSPQAGPQKALIDCPIPEIFYGGARGGGKTDGVIGKYALKGEIYGDAFNAIFFRRELPMCDDAIERSHEILSPLGWKYNGQKFTWRSPQGARLRFRPLERVEDADKYQGQNVSDACVEEAGQYPDPKPIDRLNGVLRSAKGIPTQLLLTGNPGGAGQGWIRARYIDPAPFGMRVLRRELPGGREHRYVFIPSKLQNNRFLGEDYVSRLYMVGSEELVRAWLEGDWSAVEGAFFDCWSMQRHVLRTVALPPHWMRFRSFDWGSASPFSVGWHAVASEDWIHPDGREVPKGALVRYREWYGADGPNSGLKLKNEEIAEGVIERTPKGEAIAYTVADPSTFKQDGGPSIAEQLLSAGLATRRGDNNRMAGWSQMRQRLIGHDDPMYFVFDQCKDFIRTVPVLQHSNTKPEDLDTDGEDHVADEARYACMSRPYVKPEPGKERPRYGVDRTFNELRDLAGKRRGTGYD